MSSIFQNLVRLFDWLGRPSDPAIAERGIVVLDVSWETLASDFFERPTTSSSRFGGYHTSIALTSIAEPPEAGDFAVPRPQIMAIPPFTWSVCPVT
jgi:hypothetical protein